MSTGPDPTLARLLMDTPVEHRAALATVFGEADLISRHLPMHSVPAAIRAVWIDICAMDAEYRDDPAAIHLRRAAVAAIYDASQPMEPLIGGRVPDTPEGL